ncbi:MAG: hypothetical protein HRU18_06955 [Pseudoalteromonas sp.]|uniref:hypothetical protein n=1 Tax=Pseudoalteromonas sp. TaxID=53249 RepID=UPI001DE60CAD|nr:hypothetical protein [Pseudoalteromonas sp.]NRA77930.1 hypothetical protein [Pseudoalteromonas sp.]
MKISEVIADMVFGKIDTRIGICDNVLTRAQYTTEEWFTFKDTFKTWPQYSGSRNYPIPSDDPTESPNNQFYQCTSHRFPDKFWAGAQADKRLSLLAHIDKELSNEPT